MNRDFRDLEPATSGYVVAFETGERLHVWTDIGLVVSELAGEPQTAAVTALVEPLTEESAQSLAVIWREVLRRWRGRR